MEIKAHQDFIRRLNFIGKIKKGILCHCMSLAPSFLTPILCSSIPPSTFCLLNLNSHTYTHVHTHLWSNNFLKDDFFLQPNSNASCDVLDWQFLDSGGVCNRKTTNVVVGCDIHTYEHVFTCQVSFLFV